MARVPLIGGAYAARSIIANAQRCINLFPEINPKDSPVPVTHYQRPGLRQLAQGIAAPVRGLYRASNGNGYCVIGANVYSISANWALTLLGQITAGRTNPVSFIDNGIDILLVDGSPNGWSIVLASNAFAQIVDGTGTFVGANKVDYIDTFMLFGPAVQGTNQFGSTLSNSLTFDALYVASKTDYPDPLLSLFVNRHEIILFGALKSEIWYDAGLANFPFAELPGAYIEHGLAAIYSPASYDISVYWLSQDLMGQGMVLRQRGYETKRVSNHALEFAIRKMATTVGISDAIGYCYQQDGHVFYVLSFPAGNQTWVYDEATNEWHQRCWTDQQGNLNRDRTNCHAFINGTNVVGDWQNGTLYALDLDHYTDDVTGIGQGSISFIRSFPHVLSGKDERGQLMASDFKRTIYDQFVADLECGTTEVDALGNVPQVGLRWSNDRGRTYGNTVLQSAGQTGQYLTSPQWRQLGLARDAVFELSYSFAGPAALNGAWIEARLSKT